MHFLINLGLAFLGLVFLVLIIAVVILALRSILSGMAIGLIAATGLVRNVPRSIRSVPWRSKEHFAWSDLLLLPAVLIGAAMAGFAIGPLLEMLKVR